MAKARQFVRAQLGGDVDIDTATLLVSEVVTNAILHARTAVTLTVQQLGAAARIAVHDGSPVRPRVHAFSVTAATGRGLRLLDQLAEHWGVDADPRTGGKTVWFEVGEASDDPWAGAAAFAGDWPVEDLIGDD